MNALVPLADVISALAFLAAAVLTLTLRPRGHRRVGVVDAWFRRFLFVALLLYAGIGVSNTLEHLGVTDALDVYEDYLELLFVPLIAYTAHQAYMRSVMNERARAFRALNRQHELTLGVIDTVPCGVVIVDAAGRVTFANAVARRVLALSEDPDTGAPRPADWIAVDEAGRPEPGAEPGCVPAFVGADESGVTQRVLWPDGRVTVLSVSSTSMLSRSGGHGGSIVAFEVVGVKR